MSQAFRRHKNGKAYPITPRNFYDTKGLTQNQRLSLVDKRQAELASKHLLEMFQKGEAGYTDYKPTPQGKEYYRPKISDAERLKLKRALVSAANKAKSQGNAEVAKIYEDTYKQMVIEPKNKQKLYRWESAPVFNGQKLSGYVWASSSESALRKVKTLKESPCSGLSNANPTVKLTTPPNGIYYAIGYNQKKGR